MHARRQTIPKKRSTRPHSNRRTLVLGTLCLTALSVSGCHVEHDATYEVEVRRTDAGIPHIRALDFASLGYGTAYAMAQDNLCLMADQFLTHAAERALFLGDEDGNLASDFFHKMLLDRGDADEPVSEPLEKLFRGAAAGFNRYLREFRGAYSSLTCANKPWLREVSAADFRRITRSEFLLPYFSRMLIAAEPPKSGVADSAQSDIHLNSLLPEGMGSNAMALGREVTRNRRGLLLANPHQRWHGANQRFHALHQTLPGELDVLGANQINRPNVGFGTSEHVAWTSTVSTAKRFTFYMLTLVPGQPTTYLFDGKPMKMTQRVVTVSVRKRDGTIGEASHTFYTTHFGAFLVGGKFPWSEQVAFSARFTTSGWRGAEALLPQYQAKTVAELKAVHDQYQFLPVNLIAADSEGNTLYADPGPTPNVSDAKAAECTVFHGAALDGSKSTCQWDIDPAAAIPGIYGPEQLPTLVRSDYVSNSNDTYWLANPDAPLTGFNANLGEAENEQTLRSRTGLDIVRQRIAGTDGLGEPGFTLDLLQTLALQNRNKGGELMRDAMVELCTASPSVALSDGSEIDISEACPILANWDLRSDLASVGAVLFRETLRAGGGKRRLPTDWKFAVPFDAADPIHTPRELLTDDNPAVLRALGVAVQTLRGAGIALDAPLGDVQSVTRNDERIPLHGGEEFEGVYNKLSAGFVRGSGYPEVTGTSSSWIQATEFTDTGPRVRALLTYSLSAERTSAHFADQTKLYSEKNWVEIPFRHEDVVAATLSHTVLSEGAEDCADGGWISFTTQDFDDETACRASFRNLRAERMAEMKARSHP
ncbi:MAG: penicillin acylase family protein [Myxococcota bacterium]|nr:penicillin acylase family protein [Myxococcota bacterium]